MAETTYILNQDSPENIPGFEQYQDSDKKLITSFQVNSLFNSSKNFVELHIVDFADTLLESDYNFRKYTLSLDAASAGKEGATVLTLDPIRDSLDYGYSFGGVKLLYHFLSDLYTKDFTTLDFFIDSISPDRTEISLLTNKLTPEEVTTYTEAVKTRLQSQSYFSEFRLNFKDNNIFIGVNIDTLDTANGKSVIVKLYEPLPEEFEVKSILNIVEPVSDSVAYEIDYELSQIEAPGTSLRSPNFNIDVQDNNVVPSKYFNYDELLGYQVGNTNSQIFSIINEKGIDVSVDYSDYSNFVHFSSAQERLINFKYKLDLLSSYSASLSTVSSATGGAQGVSGSTAYYQNLYQGVINNFDHYERFLYYESGSSSWPKSNSTRPYINIPSKDPNTQAPNAVVTAWYSNALTETVYYDNSNYNALTETIPTYLRDDPSNDRYLTFVYMIGQHFDNLWVYGKAVTDKYDNDNRLDFGISKDLVGEALKNFGVKLYTSNKSVEDLFSTFIGQAYQSGSEKINVYVTGSLTGSNASIQPSSYDNYQKEVYKRIYHNLPLLIKSKGTERGLRSLINCLGIPSDILKIKIYGGRNTNERPFYGDYQHYTGSLAKVRVDHTGSLVSGSTLSQYTSIVKRDDKYTDDLHPIEIGFSPTDNVDNYIISKSLSTGSLSNFNIDNYIGDPRNLTLDSYYSFGPSNIASQSLSDLTNTIMSGSTAYNVQDYVRLIKFFDNTVFKMVKDFVPARSVVDTGVIIKPHLLGRSKAKSVIVTGSRPEYSGSIDTAFAEGSDGGIFKTATGQATTGYFDEIQTANGIITSTFLHGQEQPKYNGELKNSEIVASTVDLNEDNIYKTLIVGTYSFPIQFVSASLEVCTLQPYAGTYYITSSTTIYNGPEFFNQGINSSVVYKTNISNAGGNTLVTPYIPAGFPRAFSNISYNTTFNISASNVNSTAVGGCQANTTVKFATCSLAESPAGILTTNVSNAAPGTPYNIRNWFTVHPDQVSSMQCTIANVSQGTTYGPVALTSLTSYIFNSPTYLAGNMVNVTINDPNLGGICNLTKQVQVGICVLGSVTRPTRGFEFNYSTYA
jgi:hypothetical protein